MKTIVKSVLLAAALLLLPFVFSSAARADTAACSASVAPVKLSFFSDELARRWQIAYREDVGKIREMGGRLSRETNALEVAQRLRDANFSLSKKRREKTVELRSAFEDSFRSCLDAASQTIHDEKVAALQAAFERTAARIKATIKRTGKKFKTRYKKASRKIKKIKKPAARRKAKKRLTKMVATRKRFVRESKARIQDARSFYEAGVDEAARELEEALKANVSTARKHATSHYRAPLDLIAKEPDQVRETFAKTRKVLAILARRAIRNPYEFGRPVNGVPAVNWSQVSSGPSIRGKARPALKGREAVRVEKPSLAGGGNVLMVGDSIQELMGRYVQGFLPNSVRVDRAAVGGANSFQITDLFRNNYQPARHSVIVFDAGTNDNPTLPSIMRDNMRIVARKIGPRRCMVVPTVNTLYVGGTGPGPKNSAIREFARSRPLTVVPDWYGATQKNPSLLQSDRLHPSSSGGKVRARMIAEAITSCMK